MTRRLIVGTKGLLFMALAQAITIPAQAAPPPENMVKVHLVMTYSDDGFVDGATKRLSDSAQDVLKELSKRKWMILVNSSTEAQVVLSVETSGDETTGKEIRSTNVFDAPGTRQMQTATTVRLRILVGGHEHFVEGSTQQLVNAWKVAAIEATKRATTWIAVNRERIHAQP